MRLMVRIGHDARRRTRLDALQHREHKQVLKSVNPLKHKWTPRHGYKAIATHHMVPKAREQTRASARSLEVALTGTHSPAKKAESNKQTDRCSTTMQLCRRVQSATHFDTQAFKILDNRTSIRGYPHAHVLEPHFRTCISESVIDVLSPALFRFRSGLEAHDCCPESGPGGELCFGRRAMWFSCGQEAGVHLSVLERRRRRRSTAAEVEGMRSAVDEMTNRVDVSEASPPPPLRHSRGLVFHSMPYTEFGARIRANLDAVLAL